jgi:hypothetical protein
MIKNTIKKCKHDKRKSLCKECGGGSLCKHDKEKSHCKECGGSTFCKHDKRKSTCHECNGSSFCKHEIRKSRCKECGGSELCKHNKQKSQCKECGSNRFCEHNKFKSICHDCGGSSLCKHDKRKSRCKECNDSAFCKHDKLKSLCKECDGSELCKHGKVKCKECGGPAFCKHNKFKERCKECGGSALCKTPNCLTYKIKKYHDHCLNCYIHLFPNESNSRNYKTKEKTVSDFILKEFIEYSWISDKKIEDGCSKRRPDLLLDLGYHIIIIEIDETQHKNYDEICENKRIMEISQDLGHRPIIFIRFNPDSYKNKKNKLINSCWQINKLGICCINKKNEWNNRLKILKQTIEFWCNENNKSTKMIEIVELFFDEEIIEEITTDDDSIYDGSFSDYEKEYINANIIKSNNNSIISHEV